MMLAFYTILFIIACLVLARSAALLVKTSVKMAAHFHLSEFTIAFILMAVATSIPELFVGISSAVNKAGVLSLGNLIGANIVVMTLVIGLAAILGKGIKMESLIIKRNSWHIVLITLLSIILMLDRRLSRLEGAVLLIIFLLYMLRLYTQRTLFRKEISHTSKKEVRQNLLLFIFGLAALLVSSYFIVKLGLIVALALRLPPILFGLIIISIGTTLPELSFQTKAVLTGHKEMALGNLFGGVVVNLSLILGIVALIQPIEIINFTAFLIAAGFMFFILIILNILIRTKDNLSWQEGIVLIFGYIIFIILEILFKTGSG